MGTQAARETQGKGAGGDSTVYIDALAESIVLRGLEAEHEAGRSFRLISEEVGEKSFGEGGDVIVVDPIDGSHNAKMGVPYFSLALAAARDRTLGSVYEAAVRNLATGDHYSARAGEGAWLNGEPLKTEASEEFEILQIEPTRLRGEGLAPYAGVVNQAHKIRMLGSAALNISLCATGAISVSLAPTLRSVDCAGPLLILREAGGVACDYRGQSLDALDMALDNRTSVAVATDQRKLDAVLEVLRTSGASG